METAMNIVVLQGTLSSEPVERTLRSGTNIMNWELTTQTEAGKRTVPVQWDDPSSGVLRFGEGDAVVVFGQIRRRFFQTGGATTSRTEVVAAVAAKPSQKAAVAKLLQRAQDALAA
jgi:single-strand DNA-binding protein